jgi:PAS domain S-box-containing protein
MPSAVPSRPRGGKFFLAAAISLVAVLALCAVSAVSYVASTRWVDHTLDVRAAVYEWLTAVLDAETGSRGYVASDQAVFLEPYESALAGERAKAALVRSLVADNPGQMQNVEAADRDAQVVMDHLRELVELMKAGHRDAEDRPVGLLGMGFREPRAFSADERAFIETLTSQCAQALLRASRMEREDEAHRLLATTLQSIGDAVIATDVGGRITFMNPIAAGVTGWIESDARGRPLEEVFCIFSEETRKIVESPVTKVLREGTVVGLANHTVLRSKRGIEIPIDDSGAPIRDDGRIVGVVLVFRDVTHEKRDRVRNESLFRGRARRWCHRSTTRQLSRPWLVWQCAFAAGYQMHVTKPVEPAQLAIVVANLGGRSLDEA